MDMGGTGMDPQTVLWFGIAATPIIIALVEVIKRATNMNSKFAPLVAVGLGLLGGFVFHLSGESEHTIYQALTGGVLAGLSASGLYSGAKAVTRKES